MSPDNLDEQDRHILTLALIALLAEGEGEENTPKFKANVQRVAKKLGLLEEDNLLDTMLKGRGLR